MCDSYFIQLKYYILFLTLLLLFKKKMESSTKRTQSAVLGKRRKRRNVVHFSVLRKGEISRFEKNAKFHYTKTICFSRKRETKEKVTSKHINRHTFPLHSFINHVYRAALGTLFSSKKR